jgi:DNA invertase Pin-like site-specific DNA recombinase
MLIGYARVSTDDQKPDLQLKALGAAGRKKMFVESTSRQALAYRRSRVRARGR